MVMVTFYIRTENNMRRFGRTLFLMGAILAVLALGLFATACAESEPPAAYFTISYVTETEEIPSVRTTAGSKIYPPEDPVRDGYRFRGWLSDGEPFTFGVMPERDLTLYADWTKLYKLSFDTGEGAEPVEAQYYEAGEAIELPAPPTRAHYLFDGWLLDGAMFGATAMPDEDLRLTAAWSRGVTITFITNSADYTVPSILARAGEAVEAPKVERKGYHLNCWRTAAQEEYAFTVMPDEDLTLYADWLELSNLPALFVDLYDDAGGTYPLEAVQKDPYVTSTVSLENTENGLPDKVSAGFKGRGNGSWTDIPYPKRGYKIKFDKKQSLFGREANKHWVIIACVSNQFDEPTMSRNYLAYNMANELFDGIEYTTAAHWIDVYVNGEYRGVYLLCEHVRVDKGRVDIESDYLGADSDPASTGYLIEYDAYAAGEENEDYFNIRDASGNTLVKYPFTVHSPDPEDDEYLTEGVSKAEYRKQIAYIRDYVQDVYRAALAEPVDWETFSSLADVDSFVEMYILHELFKNTDTGYSSFYLYKKPNGKLYAGPAWDFDATCYATRGDETDHSPQGIYVAGRVQTGSSGTASELYLSLYRNYHFREEVAAHWQILAPKIKAFLDERLNDEVYEANKAAMGSNYARWLNKDQKTAEEDWVRDVKVLKQWLTDRIDWLTKEWY